MQRFKRNPFASNCQYISSSSSSNDNDCFVNGFQFEGIDILEEPKKNERNDRLFATDDEEKDEEKEEVKELREVEAVEESTKAED